MARALVTGATGFVGRHLVNRLLADNNEVVCFVRDRARAEKLFGTNCQYVVGSLSDNSSLHTAVNGCDTAYHVAGATKAVRSQMLTDVNQAGTKSLLEACTALSSPPVTIIVSSLAAAGPSAGKEGRNELDPVCPVSKYGKSKLKAEEEAFKLRSKIPITIIRPPIVLGPGDRDGFEMFRTVSQLGLHFVPGFREIYVSWVFVEDLANALVRAASRAGRLDDQKNGVYFVAGRENVSFAELGQHVASALGRSARIIPSPPAALWAVGAVTSFATLLTRRPHVMNLDKAREATAGSWTCNPSKFNEETDFQPSTTLNTGMKITAEWYRENGWLK